MHSFEPLSLIFDFRTGIGQLSVSLDHPIVAPFRVGISEGRPPGSWRYLVALEDAGNAPVVTGTFVHTPGDRVLFFPGASVTLGTDNPNDRFNNRRVDHITADPPVGMQQSSHIAFYDLPRDRSRGLRYRSTPPPGHMWPWFSLLLPDLSGFTRLPNRLIVNFPPPRPDIERFGRQLLADGGVIALPLPPPPGPPPTYLQFDIWIARGPEWRSLAARPLPWPYIPEVVQNGPAHDQQLTLRRVNLEFGSDLAVAVLLSKPFGTLAAPRVLRPRLSR